MLSQQGANIHSAKKIRKELKCGTQWCIIGFERQGTKLIQDIIDIKRKARCAMQGKFARLTYAWIMPQIFGALLALAIICAVPGLRESLELCVRGAFSSAREQIDYLMETLRSVGLVLSVSTFLLSFMRIGTSKMMLDAARGGNPAFGTLFAFFQAWFPIMIASGLISLPGYIISMMESAIPYDGSSLSSILIAQLLTLAAEVIGLIIILKLSLVQYVLADCGGRKPFYAIRASWRLMSARLCVKWLVLEISFVLWFVLALFTMGITLLHTIPYMCLAQAEFYERAKRGKRAEIASVMPKRRHDGYKN